MTSGRRLFVVCYTASGAAALVYEVAWTRMLTLQLGHTVAAASTVLAAFMGGLALGAWIIARLPIRGLRAYAALEIVIAACALVLPFALAATVPLLSWVYADGAAPAQFAVTRIVISLALLGLPAAAMGATFPLAADCLSSRGRESFSDPGLLYAANTAGAAIGAISAGFWLIPALGLRGTTWVGVGLNVLAAGGAMWISSQPVTATTEKTPDPKSRRPSRRGGDRESRTPATAAAPALACALAALSGFAALIYEVAWTRLLALVFGPTTYAFATMAAAFVSGLAIGSAVGTRLARRTGRPDLWLAGLLILSGATASLSAWIAATQVPLIVAAHVADPAVDFSQVIAMQAIGIGLLLLPMTLALGATFPFALAVATDGETTARQNASRVYSANTVGAIAGALIAGFALIPVLGVRLTFMVASLTGVIGGGASLAWLQRNRNAKRLPIPSSAVVASAKRLPTPAGLIAVVGGLVLVLALPRWDDALLASGAYKYAPYLGASDLDSVLRAGVLEFYREGAAGTVSVRRLNGTTSLAIDGKVDASNGGDMLTQRLLGLLPTLIHGRAKEICVIGLGSGVTAGSALAAGTVEHADIVEISPEVVTASRFFDRESGSPLTKPGVRLIVGDGRSHLLLTPRRYDVIVSEPSNPWMAGVATLFTREFFEAARARLNAGGIICQWAHTYDISAADLRSIVRTFSSVFPQGTMWMVGGGDLLLIGSRDGDIAPRLAAIDAGARIPTVTATLADVGIANGTVSFALLSQFAGGPDDLRRYAGDAVIQTDDRTALEYSAPRAIYGRSRDDNAADIKNVNAPHPPAVARAFDAATGADWASRGLMELKSQAFPPAYESFRRAVAKDTANAAALSGLSDAAGGSGKLTEERDWLQKLAADSPANGPLRIELSRVLMVTGDGSGAIQTALAALQLTPDDARAAEQLASVLADTGDKDRLAAFADSMAARFPDRPDPQFYRAQAFLMHGRNEDAMTTARLVTERFPSHARAQNVLGAACAALNQLACAKTAFDASIRANPREPSAYVNAGLIALQSANAAAAAGYFASALTIDPSSKPAHDGLALARSLRASRN